MDEIYKKAKIEISNRHVHLNIETSEKLFGKGKKLTSLKRLSQIGQFAANEVVTCINGEKRIDGVRVVGPERKKVRSNCLKQMRYIWGWMHLSVCLVT